MGRPGNIFAEDDDEEGEDFIEAIHDEDADAEDDLEDEHDDDLSASESEDDKSVTLQDEASLGDATEDATIPDDGPMSSAKHDGDGEDDGDDDDYISDEDDDYMQKLDKDVVQNHIAAIHPESAHVNYQEVLALCNVTRDAGQNVVDPLHKTIPFLTKYEFAHVIGLRAQQINAGSPPFVKVDRQVVEGHLIAQIEIRQKKVPFIICRPLPGGGTEYWKLSDLGILF